MYVRSWFILLGTAVAIWFVTLNGAPAPLPWGAQSSAHNWQALKTEHFEILFPEDLFALAKEAALLAERAHEYWAQKLQYSESAKTYIVLTDRSDVTTVVRSIFPHNVIVIDHPFGWSTELWSSPKESWLEEIIFTEYGRIVDATRVEGITADLRAIFGSLVAPGLVKPLWWREGLIYQTHRDPGLGEMSLRVMAESERWPTLAQLSSPYQKKVWPSADVQADSVGSALLAYLDETYGHGAIQEISRAYATNLLGSFPSGPLSITTGQSSEKTYQDFQFWIEERLALLRDELRSQGGIAARTPLGSLEFWSVWPAESPLGDAIAYYHQDPQRSSGLRWIRPNGADEQPLLACECGPPTWLDAITLTYPKLGITHGSRVYDLYLYDLESRREVRLTYGERLYQVESFLDGRRLLFARNGTQGTSALVVFDLLTKSRQVLMEFDMDQRVHSMSISPDGKLIALSLWKSKQEQDIYLMNSQGGEPIPLTQDPALDFDPVFSPDGRFILFSSNREGIFDVYALRLGDRQLFRVTRSLSGSFDPAVSSDGRHLLVVGYSQNGFGLQLVEYDPARWSVNTLSSNSGNVMTPQMPSALSVEKDQTMRPVIYDPVPTLIPTFWVPFVGMTEVGFFTQNEDPLHRHRYDVNVGLSTDTLEFFYAFGYINNQFFPAIHFRVQGSAVQERQEFALEFPWGESLNRQRVLMLALGQERGAAEVSLTERLMDTRGFDLFQRHSSLAIQGSLTWPVQGLARRLMLEWREEFQLPLENPVGPHGLLFRVSAAWSDREEFRLGGASGKYPLRGFGNIAVGSELLSMTAEYRFPVWAMEWGCCGDFIWPLFLDDLRGSLFVDAGTVGSTLELDQSRIALGVELQLDVVLGYGLMTGSLRVGFAYGIGTEQPQVYLMLEPRFSMTS